MLRWGVLSFVFSAGIRVLAVGCLAFIPSVHRAYGRTRCHVFGGVRGVTYTVARFDGIGRQNDFIVQGGWECFGWCLMCFLCGRCVVAYFRRSEGQSNEEGRVSFVTTTTRKKGHISEARVQFCFCLSCAAP